MLPHVATMTIKDIISKTILVNDLDREMKFEANKRINQSYRQK